MNLFEFIAREGITIEKNKGEHIFMQGDQDKSLYFIQSGLLKAYYSSEDGKEFIKSFLMPNDLIGSLTSVYSGENCFFSLVCLETSTLKIISFELLQEYCKKDVELANHMIEILMLFSMKKEKREYEFLCLSAEMRFSLLVQNSPSLIKKITQNDLARYLGITPVGLSRIKKRQEMKKSSTCLS